MSWLDILIVVIFAIAVFWGLKTGIIKAVLSLAGVIIGIILAGQFYVPLSGLLSFIPQENIAEIVAFALIFIVVMIVAAILAKILSGIVSAMMLGWVNRLGGAVFGLVVGGLLCGALLAVWVKFFGINELIRGSVLPGFLLDRFPAVLALLPPQFDAIRSFFQ